MKKPITIKPNRFTSLFKSAFERAAAYGEILTPAAMNEAELKDYRERQMELHPSSLPYCGLRDAWTILADEGRRVDMGGLYFMNAGHAFHEAVQFALGRTAKVHGNWKCNKCGARVSFSTLPAPCKCVKRKFNTWKYHELGGKLKRPGWSTISWHSDGLFEVNGEFWVIDYKTTGSHLLAKHRKSGDVFPYPTNREQIRSYCVLIAKKYKVKISGFALIYIARDNPTYSSNVEVCAERIEPGDLEDWADRIEKAAKEKAIANTVRENPMQVFAKLQPVKLCPNRDFYEQNVQTPWDECPLADFCQSKKKLLATLQDELDNREQGA